MRNLLIIAAIIVVLGAGMMARSQRNENLADTANSPAATSSLREYRSADSLQYALEGMLPMMTARADVEALLVRENGAAAGPAVPRNEGGYKIEYGYGHKIITVFYDDRGMTKSTPLVRDRP